MSADRKHVLGRQDAGRRGCSVLDRGGSGPAVHICRSSARSSLHAVAVAVCSVGHGKPSADVQNARTLERHVAVSVISFEKSMNLAS